MIADSPFMTAPEVAARWRLNARVVREALAAQPLAGRKIGGRWLILPQDVEEYEASRLNVRPVRHRRRLPYR